MCQQRVCEGKQCIDSIHRWSLTSLFKEKISLLQTKSGIALRCEGSEKEIPAKISYISPEASYRPPVLYSRDQSEKLAFLVEAVPLELSTPLHPGQPVTVVFSK